MKKLLAFGIATVFLCLYTRGQLTCTNAAASDTTIYSNGMSNDSLYFICDGDLAHLVATPPSGTPGWNFEWYNYSAATNSWIFNSVDTNLPTSSRNANIGGWKVKIYDGDGLLVGSYITWICKIYFAPIVNANVVSGGCGPVTLAGLFINGNVTGYYNPPAENASLPLIIDEDTEISVCFTANHSYVSDLAFYFVGPPSCGSPNLLLSPNPGALGQDTICNFGNGVTNLCFSNQSPNNLDVCNGAPFTLSGTYGSYGPDATPIDWSILNGCNANMTGWSVQIYDCIAGDFGVLTDATITFTGTDPNGDALSVGYTTPVGFSSPINDNTCDAQSASSFSVSSPINVAVPIQNAFGFEWVADPPVNFPNGNNTLNILLDPGPTVSTDFTLHVVGPNIGNACYGLTSDTEHFEYIAPQTAILSVSDNVLCTADDPQVLASNIANGAWYGPGVADPAVGIFDPQLAGAGTWDVFFLPASSCITGSSLTFEVVAPELIQIDPVNPMCSNELPIDLSVNTTGGVWSGNGITDTANGIFDPSLVTNGQTQISYTKDGICAVSDVITIAVQQFQPLEISSSADAFCVSDAPENFETNVGGGAWSGAGMSNTSSGLFDPQLAGVGTWVISYSYDGVCFDDAQLTIDVIDDALSVLSVDPICISSGTINMSASVLGGIWSGEGITNQITGSFNPMSIGTAGDYTVYYQLDNVCESIDSTVIQIFDFPVIDFNTPAGVCLDNAPITLLASPSSGTWSGNGITNAITGAFDPSLVGVGTIEVEYTFTNVCTSTASTSLEVYGLPIIDVCNDTSICYNGFAELYASGAATYAWQPTSDLNVSNIQSPEASPATTTVYNVVGTSANGCLSSSSVTVNVWNEPEVSVNGPFSICTDEQIQLEANGLVSYNWTGAGLSNNSIGNPIADPDLSTVYTVSGYDGNGCEGSASIEVNVMQPSAEFVPSIVYGVSPLQVVFQNNSVGDDFIWDFGNGNTLETFDPSENPQMSYFGDETFTVTLTSLLGGCPATFSMEVTSYFDSEILVIPNVVTLGGDSKNDNFRLVTQNMDTLEVLIFDRWGKEVGKIENPASYWNPISTGTGVYYYTYKALGLDHEKYSGAGSFTVLE